MGDLTSVLFLNDSDKIAGKTIIVESNAKDRLINVMIPKFDKITKSEMINALNPPMVVNAETKIGFDIFDKVILIAS